MTTHTQALLTKEWIKLRKGLVVPAFLLLAACVDTFLVLRGIEGRHGALGLWLTLLEKEPPFYRGHLALAASGLMIGFLQAWPECQGRRLRLLFHLPIEPSHSVAMMLIYGQALVAALSLGSLGLTTLTMGLFGLPIELIRPVLLSLAPWLILAHAFHLAMVALLAARSWSLRLGVFTAGYAAWGLMASGSGYGLLAPALPALAGLAGLFVPLAFHAFLTAMGERRTWGHEALRAGALGVVSLALIHLLPSFTRRLLPPAEPQGRIFYSPVQGQFTRTVPLSQKALGPNSQDSVRYQLESGRELTRLQYAEALPVLYIEDLLKWKRFPETIAGEPVEPLVLKHAWQYRQQVPSDWNGPERRLHLMLESSPRGARLELPGDLFRLSSDRMRLEFLRPGKAGKDDAKGQQFTQALAQAGFAFPVQAMGSNPDVRKEYDLGHLMVDAQGGVFRLAMVEGKPQCWRGSQRVEGRVRGIQVQEHRSRRWAGSIVTDTDFHLVDQRTLSLVRLPIEGFTAEHSRLSLWSDPFGLSFVHQRVGELRQDAVALDPGLKQIRTWSPAVDAAQVRQQQRTDIGLSILFPLRLEQGAANRSWEDLHLVLAPRPSLAFLASGTLALGLAVVQGWRKRIRPVDLVFTVCFGWAGLLALALLGTWRIPRLGSHR